MGIIISGVGSYIPAKVVQENDFVDSVFYNDKGERIVQDIHQIIEKFYSITNIKERRYAEINQSTSDLGFEAAKAAIKDANINPEDLSGIIFAHNYGDVSLSSNQSDTVPGLGARVKHLLGIENPSCVVFDVMGGCPGWIQSVIIAKQFIANQPKQSYLVIGAETLSRVTDPHDRDTMIFADGAGAVVLTYEDSDSGILSIGSKSFTKEEVNFLNFGYSYNKEYEDASTRFIKMKGHKIYEFALTQVPIAMKECFDASGYSIDSLAKIFLHQANGKMDEAILKRFYRLYGKKAPDGVMPMSIEFLGNSSVATVPTLLDLVMKEQLEGHQLNKGDIILMASVGAGMNVNAITYRV